MRVPLGRSNGRPSLIYGGPGRLYKQVTGLSKLFTVKTKAGVFLVLWDANIP